VGSAIVAALRALDRGGVVAVNAIHLDEVPAFPYELLWWERAVRSVANVTRADAREFLALAAAIPIRTAIEVHPLADGAHALQRVAASATQGTPVLVPGPEDG
jgi:propanol-preferring alcohol dehydrogenase